MVQRIWDESGPLTGLVNNAAGNFISPTKDLTPNGFNAIANIVFHGTFYVTQAVGKRWIAGGHKGSVISILVTWVHTGSPYVVPSAMSKAGLHVMTKSLAVEWGKYGIRLNAIAPGPFPTEGATKRLRPGGGFEDATELNPMRRVGRMPELQNLATFLMADGCEWLTGETIAIDGAGYLATGAAGYYVALDKLTRRRLGAHARDDQGAERQGPRRPYRLMARRSPPGGDADPPARRRRRKCSCCSASQSAAFLGGAYVFPGGVARSRSDACCATRARPDRRAGERAAEAVFGRPRLLRRRDPRMLRGSRGPARAGGEAARRSRRRGRKA